MALKTNYKNYIPDANGRVYSITQNAQGKSVITDKTNYIQVGDNFGANDINAITTEVNRLADKSQSETNVNIPTTGWTSSNGYYYQDFTVSGMTSTYIGTDAVDFVRPTKNASYPTNYDKYKEMFMLITDIESYDGYIRVYVSEQPTTQITIILYGV